MNELSPEPVTPVEPREGILDLLRRMTRAGDEYARRLLRAAGFEARPLTREERKWFRKHYDDLRGK